MAQEYKYSSSGRMKISAGYKPEDVSQLGAKNFNNFERRNYNFDGLERELLG